MCALLVKTAVVELLKFPFRMIKAIFSTSSDLMNCNSVNKGAIRVPTFYAPPAPHKLSRPDWLWFPLIITVAMLFGGIHCAGWNFPFPTHAELIIWRISSLIILIFPCNFVVVVVVAAMPFTRTILGTIIAWVCLFGILIYVLARFALFVEAFVALRHLPPGAYAVVEWTALLLHM